MSDWNQQLRHSITTGRELAEVLPVVPEAVNRVAAHYPVRITPYVLSLIESPGDPIWRQYIPDEAELADGPFPADPFGESHRSPVPGLVHRYPDRVLLLVTRQCAVYCRHCMRKRDTGHLSPPSVFDLDQAAAYIRSDPSIREVILSGGDPLLLSDERLVEILSTLKNIDHVEILRIHTRAPSALPQRVTPALALMLRRFQPLYVVTQFNHATELSVPARKACDQLVDAGVPLFCQSVLLRGVNDNADTLETLLRTLIRHRVRPYYLHHPDPVRGTGHFRVPVNKGLQIMDAIRNRMSGIGIPHYVADTFAAAGKVPLSASNIPAGCHLGFPDGPGAG